MARVELAIADSANRITLKAMLEADGHTVVDSDGDVFFCDDATRAVEAASERPVLILTASGDVREAVKAMRRGVYGYVLLPFLPGEASLMVERASGHPLKADDPKPMTLEEVETRHLLDTLRRCRGNQAEAARVLAIGRNTLWRKLKRIQGQVQPPKEE